MKCDVDRLSISELLDYAIGSYDRAVVIRYFPNVSLFDWNVIQHYCWDQNLYYEEDFLHDR